MRGKKILIGVMTFLVILTGIFLVYVNDYYKAEEEALVALESNEAVHVTGEDPIQVLPAEEGDKEVGIIFYPGGKVEEEAYGLLMQQLAEQGYSVFLVDMPFNLAVFDIQAAEEIMANNPEISKWYLAGHSLGGSMAAIFASKEVEELAGLILLASYSTADLSASNLPVLSLYGSEDAVIDVAKLEEYRPMLPEDHIEKVIEGGNHAQFGNYGEQEGDGEALISAEEQQQITVEAITQFIESY
ncbi:alpha/beta hydrolase [Jeotgalibaca caeni]|uniref:alpha/beta hydrolase n=1 Tax=Jeotgalibaca caeni TaxID=3028623 RepID=UPI00237DF4FF|nr:alpha/beta hydrolase [Jeotgalibaca caeni]MDE1549506.1 alpha/beta hydrolase [Jeotgalibaca caeni]